MLGGIDNKTKSAIKEILDLRRKRLGIQISLIKKFNLNPNNT